MKKKCVADIGFDCVCYFSAFSKYPFIARCHTLLLQYTNLNLNNNDLYSLSNFQVF